jgi:hypothetical protein
LLINRIAELEGQLSSESTRRSDAENTVRNVVSTAHERYDRLKARATEYGKLFDEAVAIIATSSLPEVHRHALTQYLKARALHIDTDGNPLWLPAEDIRAFDKWASKLYGVAPLKTPVVESGAPGMGKSTRYASTVTDEEKNR